MMKIKFIIFKHKFYYTLTLIILLSLISLLSQSINKSNIKMDIGNIRSLYQASNLSANNYGVEGYFVEKKYLDINQLKQQKLYASKQKSPSSKPLNLSQKKTFIDEIQKLSAKMPAPTSYDIKDFQSRSRTQSLILPGNRKTIFDQIQYITKKANFPDPVKYSKVEVDTDKSKLKGNLSKADNANYLESSMRDALNAPGVGSYNSNRSIFGSDKKGAKWIEGKSQSKSENKTKLPPVGTYDPKPLNFSLFSSLASIDKGKSKSYFSKTERFKQRKQKQIPYYNVLSEWGLKDKGSKKDILSKITKAAGHSSVYY